MLYPASSYLYTNKAGESKFLTKQKSIHHGFLPGGSVPITGCINHISGEGRAIFSIRHRVALCGPALELRAGGL